VRPIATRAITALFVGAAVVGLGAWSTDTPPSDDWLDANQRWRAAQLISAFENSTTEIRYAYAENLDDGRGVTAGRAGSRPGRATPSPSSTSIPSGSATGSAGSCPSWYDCEAESDNTAGLPSVEYVAAW